MTIYIRELILCDDNDSIVFKICRKEAFKGLNSALIFVAQKEGIGKREYKIKFLRDLDNEFKNFFNLRGVEYDKDIKDL